MAWERRHGARSVRGMNPNVTPFVLEHITELHRRARVNRTFARPRRPRGK